MSEPFKFMQQMNMRQFVLSTARGLVPGLLLSVACTVLVYNLLRPHFAATSLMPLLLASLCPVLGNIVSLVRSRRLDIFGVLVLLGILASIIGVLLGGGPQLLLIRESFVTGIVGLAFLVSLLLPRSLGYYFAKQFMTGNDPEKGADFDALWLTASFRRGIQGGTIFWGLLLLGEFALRILMVLMLPVAIVLIVAPLVFNSIILGGIVVSALWARQIVLRTHELQG